MQNEQQVSENDELKKFFRVNNFFYLRISLVLVEFEERMNEISTSRNFQDWQMFCTYLKTHPANKKQINISIDDVSWIKTLRMMRNIFVHEYSAEWSNFKELLQFSMQFFRSLGNISDMFDIYYQYCHFDSLDLVVKRLICQRLLLDCKPCSGNNAIVLLQPPEIQLRKANQTCIYYFKDDFSEDMSHLKLFPFFGIDKALNFVKTVKKSVTQNMFTPLIVHGNISSGVSFLLRYLLPLLLESCSFVYINLATLPRFSKLCDLNKVLERQFETYVDLLCLDGFETLLQSFQFSEIHSFVLQLQQTGIADMVAFGLNTREPTHSNLFFESLASMFPKQVFYFDCNKSFLLAEEQMKDFQLLLRFCFKCEKWWLRKSIQNLELKHVAFLMRNIISSLHHK